MNEYLRGILEEYKAYTQELIEVIAIENYDKMDMLLEKRQTILNSISEKEFNKEDLSLIYEELGISALEKRVNLIANEKKEKLRREIDNVHKAKNGTNVYNRGIYNKVSIFNKQI